MTTKKNIHFTSILVLVLIFSVSLALPASAISDADVQAQVDAVGREAVTGNVLIWFLCAIGFLKAAQKIDSFMASLGVNVGHTGGSMLAEAMIAAKGVGTIAGAMGHSFGAAGGHRGSSGGNAAASAGGFFKGGLIGMARRKATSDAVRSATSNTSAVRSEQVKATAERMSSHSAHTSEQAAAAQTVTHEAHHATTKTAAHEGHHTVHQSAEKTVDRQAASDVTHTQRHTASSFRGIGLGGAIFAKSLWKGGDFANDVIGTVARGDIRSAGTIIAVYGASGSKKTRAFCVNMILQCAARGSSMVITDPKSELYEKTSEYLRDKGYTVRVFNLVTPSASDSWNCLAEIEGKELMAQLFCDVVIKNTGSERGDHFWDNAELNLLKALVLYVSSNYPPEKRNIGEVYQLLAMSSEKELNALFEVLPVSHPAKAPYSIFKQSSENVRGGVIIGLGSRLQVFQNQDIRNITSHDEIDLELPGQKPCAYYCITSDQDSTFDFLSSLFLSFIFIKLVRFADERCPNGELPVPVHLLGEELCATGVIPDLSRKISVIRSRRVSLSAVFQNLAGLQNRYPYNQWQEILGNCDVQLFLGCTDALTAQFISDRTGEASISVTSKAKQLGTWRISNYTPEYRETSGVGRRKLMTMDEVLRMDTDKALVIIRGKNVLEVDKYDYSKHPEAKKLRPSKAASHVPEWQKAKGAAVKAEPAPDCKTIPAPPHKKAKGKASGPAKPPAAKPSPAAAPPPPAITAEPFAPEPAARSTNIVTTTKKSILVKPKEE